MEEDNNKYDKGTLGWLRKQQNIKSKKDGFNNVDDWLKWKNRSMEEKYGKEFTQWAIENNGKFGIEDRWINLGYKTGKEYRDKIAQRLGYKDHNEYHKEWSHWNGRRGISIEINEDCSPWFGEFVENLMIHYYPGAIKMYPNNHGFDYLWKDGDGKDTKIDCKGRCLHYFEYGHPILIFPIKWNDVADIFILSGWDNRESRNPLFVLEFYKNDLVKYGRGICSYKVEFWKRDSIGITYPKGLEQFKEYQIDIDLLKDMLI